MQPNSVRLFKTVQHTCGYFPDRIAQNLVIDPAAPELKDVYNAALSQGFRRAGGSVYRPACASCQSCVATRVPVAAFSPKRSQQRCWRRNADLSISMEPATYSDEVFTLYKKYLQHRHPNGGMHGTDADQFLESLHTSWSQTRFLMIRNSSQLLGCAVTDTVKSGLSAVYTFFDPAFAARSLGVFAILSQVQWAQQEALPYLYLGYWIDGHPKMNYKTQYQPIELWRNGYWQ